MPDGQPTQPTPQPEAPPVEAPAAVPQPAPAPEPTVDPRLAHLVQHYLPEGVDLDTELMHVVQGVDAEGNPSYHYRPIVDAPAPPVTPTEPPPVQPAVPAPAPAAAPVVPQPAPAPTSPVAPVVPQPVATVPAQPIVAAAPNTQITDPSVFGNDLESFCKWYEAWIAEEYAKRPVNTPVRLN